MDVASTTVSGVEHVVQFETVPFAEGTSRYAYQGDMLRPSEKRGEKVVVKKFKEGYAKYKKDWDTDVQVAKKAQQLAKKFNRVSKTTRPINFKVPLPMKVNSSYSHRGGRGAATEWVTVEEFLYGEYIKWLSNYGWVNYQEMGEGGSLPAFSHWTWVETKGQLLVCDLQGVKDNPTTGYWLTDPAIHSTSRSYGDTDLGNIGMHKFFTTHKCTGFCYDQKLENKRPNPAVLMTNMWFTNSRATVYSGQIEEAGTFSSTVYSGQLDEMGLWAPPLSMIQEDDGDYSEEEEDSSEEEDGGEDDSFVVGSGEDENSGESGNDSDGDDVENSDSESSSEEETIEYVGGDHEECSGVTYSEEYSGGYGDSDEDDD